MTRVLYFDTDGVLSSYEDSAKPALVNGALQDRLKTLGFDRLVCVSGWSDIVNTGILRKSELQQKQSIAALLKDVFEDAMWLLSKLSLAYDSDHRCQHIDTSLDWFYIDDWADKFFQEQFGNSPYKNELGRRILLVDPHADGSDIIHWLDTAVAGIVSQ